VIYLKKIENFIKNSSGVSIALTGRDSGYLRDKTVEIVKDLEGILFNSPDIMLIDPEGTEIGISEIREIRNFLTYSPEHISKKYVFVYDADRANQQAANALLKILEEPPRYAVIILTTTRWYLLLPTIRSRLVKFVLNPPPFEGKIHPWVDKIAEKLWRVRSEVKNVRLIQHVKSSENEELVKMLSEDTLKSYLSAFEILERISNSDERDFLEIIDFVSSNYSGKELFKINVLLARSALWLMEIEEIYEMEGIGFFDAISRARLSNFNNLLTLYNIAIRYREIRRRDEVWSSQQLYTV